MLKKNGTIIKRSAMGRLLLALFFFPITLLGQTFPVDPQSGKIFYSEDILVKDAAQAELFTRAKSWFANPAKREQVWVEEDAASGLLTGRTYTRLTATAGKGSQTYRLWYTVTIRVEDDRYGYYLSDFHLQPASPGPLPASKEPQNQKQPLEAVVLPEKVEEKQKGSKALSARAAESILELVEDLKMHLLGRGER